MKKLILKTGGIILLLFVAVIGILLAYATIFDYRPAGEETLHGHGRAQNHVLPDTLTLVSWNIGYAGLDANMDFFYDGGQRVRPEKSDYLEAEKDILKYLTGIRGADFVLLQEVDKRAKRSYFSDQVASIVNLFEGYCGVYAWNYNVRFVPVPIGRSMGKVLSGILSLSKHTPVSSVRMQLPGSFSWPTCLFMLDRCILLQRFLLPAGNNLVLINLHNSAFDESGNIRIQEMERIREIITGEYEKGNYVIAGGDWNMNPPGFAPGRIASYRVFTIRHGTGYDFLPEGWRWVYDPEIPTNRDVSQPYKRGETGTTIIDFFLLSPNITLLEIKTDHLDFRSSDHHPVRLKVLLEPLPPADKQ